jgi:hypothetical protein
MIFAYFLSLSVSWWFWQSVIAIIAGAGGGLVFWGLWKEGPPDEKPLLDIDAFRRHKAEARRGWNILMLGIGLEIVVAVVFAAKDGWQARQTAIEIEKNNAMNQLVFDVSAKALIRLKGPIFKELPVTNSDAPANFSSFGIPFDTNTLISGNNGSVGTEPSARVAFMSLGAAIGTNVGFFVIAPLGDFGMLQADTFSRLRLWGDHGYMLSFHPNYMGTAVMIEAAGGHATVPTVSGLVSNVAVLKIDASFIDHDSEVVGGSVDMLVNGSFRQTFKILPQKALPFQLDGWGGPMEAFPGFSLLATNPDLKIVLPNFVKPRAVP